jgi:hypothetical protein
MLWESTRPDIGATLCWVGDLKSEQERESRPFFRVAFFWGIPHKTIVLPRYFGWWSRGVRTHDLLNAIQGKIRRFCLTCLIIAQRQCHFNASFLHPKEL